VTAVVTRTERISAQARTVRPGGVALGVFAVALAVFTAVFYALGWGAGKAWLVLAWAGTAIKVGWKDAARARNGSSGS